MADQLDPGDDHLREEDGDSLRLDTRTLREDVACCLKAIAEHRGDATLTLDMRRARNVTVAAAMFLLHVIDRQDHAILNLPEQKPKH